MDEYAKGFLAGSLVTLAIYTLSLIFAFSF